MVERDVHVDVYAYVYVMYMYMYMSFYLYNFCMFMWTCMCVCKCDCLELSCICSELSLLWASLALLATARPLTTWEYFIVVTCQNWHSHEIVSFEKRPCIIPAVADTAGTQNKLYRSQNHWSKGKACQQVVKVAGSHPQAAEVSESANLSCTNIHEFHEFYESTWNFLNIFNIIQSWSNAAFSFQSWCRSTQQRGWAEGLGDKTSQFSWETEGCGSLADGQIWKPKAQMFVLLKRNSWSLDRSNIYAMDKGWV